MKIDRKVQRYDFSKHHSNGETLTSVQLWYGSVCCDVYSYSALLNSLTEFGMKDLRKLLTALVSESLTEGAA